MVITRLEEEPKLKVKVFIDDTYAFLLQQKDIEQYKLSEDKTITQEEYDKIMEETVIVCPAGLNSPEILSF